LSTAQRFDEQQDGLSAEQDEAPERSPAGEPSVVFEEDLFDEATFSSDDELE
jgi:hypothetical protein